MQNIKYILSLSFILLLGCNKDDDSSLSAEEIHRQNLETIQDYLDSEALTAQSTPSGLHYIIDEPGSGEERPSISSVVEVMYSGYFTNKSVFDATSDGQTVEFALANVIQGWQEGLQLFKKGGSGTLLLPSSLGYGAFPPPGIPPNTVLIFDVTLVNFR